MNKIDEAKCLMGSGEQKRERGDFADAEADFQEALQLYGELGDSRAQAHVWGHLGLNSQLQGNYPEAARRFGLSFLYAVEASDRGAVAIALRHLGKIHTLEDVQDKSLGLFLLKASVIGAPGSRGHKAWFRHALAGAYLANGQRLRAAWEGFLSIVDLVRGWREEQDLLKKRVWLTGALLDLGRLPLVGNAFNQITLSLATGWDLEVRKQEALRALGWD